MLLIAYSNAIEFIFPSMKSSNSLSGDDIRSLNGDVLNSGFILPIESQSYLIPLNSNNKLNNNNMNDLIMMRKIFEAVYTQQNPKKESCKTRRLLLTQFSQHSFEGMGSILRMIQMGIAEAAFSNRTLIFGLDLPYMFEKTKDVWRNKHRLKYDDLVNVSNIGLKCGSWVGQGGGSYNCFFQPLSTCSLSDVSYEELSNLGNNAYDDEARVRIQEAHRGPALYHVPLDLPLYKHIFSIKMTFPRHKWAAVIAAYSFRLKPNLIDIFEERRLNLFHKSAGGNNNNCNNNESHIDENIDINGNTINNNNNIAPIWSIHVRHGDTKALSEVYGNRQLNEFPTYLATAQQRANEIYEDNNNNNNNNNELPGSIFIISDAIDTPDFVTRAADMTESYLWPNFKIPCMFTVNPADRFRTKHGSHTVAADGGCTTQNSKTVCALHHYEIGLYIDKQSHDRPMRLMRVMLEAIEDLYYLSYTDKIITQVSSHFSTIGVMLLWARMGANDPKSAMFVDELPMVTGETHTSMLHGALNGTNKIDADNGFKRWKVHTLRFVEGLEEESILNYAEKKIRTMPKSYDNSFDLKIDENIPFMHKDLFYTEVQRWLGNPNDIPIWNIECPLKQLRNDNYIEHIMANINFGSDHLTSGHINQAIRCWKYVEKELSNNNKLKENKVTSSIIESYLDVAQGNIDAVGYTNMYPYKFEYKRLKLIFDQNLGSVAAKKVFNVSLNKKKIKK
jgi:hypothetical protein